jgi:hypothetical protein
MLRTITLCFAVLALAGCGGAIGDNGSAPQGGVASGAALSAPAHQSSQGNASGNGGSTGPIAVGTPPFAGIERAVTAAYTVPSGTFLAAFEGVITHGVGLGGYVESSNTQPDSSGRIVSGQVTMKIPAAKIADLLNGVPSDFIASSIDFSSTDHTGEFVDVNARLTSAHAHLVALNNLLEKATALGDITDLEHYIDKVKTEIYTGQGELNTLTASAELSAATMQLTERGAAPVQAAAGPVSNGISSGWSTAVQVTGVILQVAVTALPFLAIGLVAWLVWRRRPWVRTG